MSNPPISDSNEDTYGKVAFEAYRSAVDNKTYDDKPIPEWSNLSDIVRTAWNVAAVAVINAYDQDTDEIDAEPNEEEEGEDEDEDHESPFSWGSKF